ncbi:uncharacterized protein K444DRAFT_607661, partial [Hyaloscypha bicolor E]
MNSIKGEVDSMADTQQPRPLKRQRIVGDESSFKVVENVPLLGSAHQVLGDPFKIDEPPCPSLRNVVSNDDEAMDPPPPAQETERHPGPTMTGLSVLKLRRIQPGEEICFGMVSNIPVRLGETQYPQNPIIHVRLDQSNQLLRLDTCQRFGTIQPKYSKIFHALKDMNLASTQSY